MGPQLRGVFEEQAEPMGMPSGPWTALPQRTLLEIGSGSGEALLASSAHFDLVIGIDVHRRGLAATMRSAAERGLPNVRLVSGDAMEVLHHQVPPGTLAEIHIWFPDPWPKTRHHKRRLVRPEVAELLVAGLAPDGVVRLATDIASYASVMQAVLGAHSELVPLGDRGIVPRPDWRPVTRYEAAGRAAGRTVTDLAYRRVPSG